MHQKFFLSFRGKTLSSQELKGIKGGLAGMARCCVTCPDGKGGTEEYCQDCGIGNNCGQIQTTASSGTIICYVGQTGEEDMFINCPKKSPIA